MIKINLLPTKRKPAKKLTELQQQLILGSLTLMVLAGGMIFYMVKLTNTIADLRQQDAKMRAQASEQDNMLKEVKNVESEREKVNEKIKVIEQLKKNQQEPVRMLDELSRMMPKGLNFTSLTETAGQLNIDGTAFTNNEVVRFVDSLKHNRYFIDVFLVESKQVKVEGLDIYQFKLQMRFKGE